jgi:hypothetical protein
MQVKDLDGNYYHWKLIGNISHGSLMNKSQLHLQARTLLKECFPTLQVLEEIPIQLRKSEYLVLDFYLPLNKKCIEVHGEQHYKFTRFYHKDMMGFIRHKKRDQEKKEWCELNGIMYVELPYDESIDQWKQRLIND